MARHDVSPVFSFYRTLSTQVTERNATKLCHMFESKLHLKRDVQNVQSPLLKTWGPRTAYFWWFCDDI